MDLTIWTHTKNRLFAKVTKIIREIASSTAKTKCTTLRYWIRRTIQYPSDVHFRKKTTALNDEYLSYKREKHLLLCLSYVSDRHWSVWTVMLNQYSRPSLKSIKTMIKIAFIWFICHFNGYLHTKEIHERPSERYNYIKPLAQDSLPPCELS